MRKIFGNTRAVLLALLLLVAAVDIVLWMPSANDTAELHLRRNSAGMVLENATDYLRPLPLSVAVDPAKVMLGRKLFHDVRLSGNNRIACASCHELSRGGMDGRAHSTGINGARSRFNVPTVFNSGLNFVQFWDGHAATLEEQVDASINDSNEMGSNWQQVTGELAQDSEYPAAFANLYPDGINPSAIKDAIASFERSLITSNSRFDRYLRGEQNILSEAERRGYMLFVDYGCASCHQGANVGGNMYQKMGVMEAYFPSGDDVAYLGRFSVTGREGDRHVFRVPSLRLVSRTAPYFHDGSVPSLELAVKLMAKIQLGRSISDDDVHAIVQFLATLDGGYRGEAR